MPAVACMVGFANNPHLRPDSLLTPVPALAATCNRGHVEIRGYTAARADAGGEICHIAWAGQSTNKEACLCGRTYVRRHLARVCMTLGIRHDHMRMTNDARETQEQEWT